jgi:hypothetical protein
MIKLNLDLSESENIESFSINTIVPFAIYVSDYPDNEHKMASLYYLVQTNKNEMLTIYTSYLIENEFEYENIKSYPFHIENNFINFRLCADLVLSSYPIYITNFDFNYNNDEEINKFNFKAKRLTEEGEQETVEFAITSDIFASLKYIDNYIYDGFSTGYELGIASVTGRYKEDPAEIVIVDKIDRIIAIAPIEKHADTYAIEFLINRKDDKYSLLTTFNMEKKFNKRKFKKISIDKINDNFLKEPDQYLQVFTEFAKIVNMDKEYLIIKGKNKDNIDKLFFIDSTIRTELESMIDNF